MKASIIIPVYNEEKRIKPFLRELKKYENKDWEIIFVDDGSKDNSCKILRNFNIKNKKIISYKPNRGKGFAVKTGVMASKGDCIIFIDADGSIDPLQIKAMLNHLNKYEVVVGTRVSKHSEVKQSLLRRVIGTAFNIYVNMLYSINIKDNLCGFKGFRKNTAKKLFNELISERWIFDVEIFYKIRKNDITIYEMPIKWTHKYGSKIGIFDPLKMAIELINLRTKL